MVTAGLAASTAATATLSLAAFVTGRSASALVTAGLATSTAATSTAATATLSLAAFAAAVAAFVTGRAAFVTGRAAFAPTPATALAPVLAALSFAPILALSLAGAAFSLFSLSAFAWTAAVFSLAAAVAAVAAVAAPPAFSSIIRGLAVAGLLIFLSLGHVFSSLCTTLPPARAILSLPRLPVPSGAERTKEEPRPEGQYSGKREERRHTAYEHYGEEESSDCHVGYEVGEEHRHETHGDHQYVAGDGPRRYAEHLVHRLSEITFVAIRLAGPLDEMDSEVYGEPQRKRGQDRYGHVVGLAHKPYEPVDERDGSGERQHREQPEPERSEQHRHHYQYDDEAACQRLAHAGHHLILPHDVYVRQARPLDLEAGRGVLGDELTGVVHHAADGAILAFSHLHPDDRPVGLRRYELEQVLRISAGHLIEEQVLRYLIGGRGDVGRLGIALQLFAHLLHDVRDRSRRAHVGVLGEMHLELLYVPHRLRRL